jgi:putative ABC transport system permease protein
MPFGPHAVAGRGPERVPAEATLVMLTSQDHVQTAATLQGAVADLNKEVPVSQVETLSGWVSEAAAGPRSTASIFLLFAGLAVVLGAVGIYGVISYSVAQRTREIGIRIALGAKRSEVLIMVLRQSTRLALAGTGIGLLSALLLTRLMAKLLYGIGANDPATFAGVAALLIAVALAASYLPARRAMRVDPVVALRYE